MGGRQARRLCPHAVVVRPRFRVRRPRARRCSRCSRTRRPLVEGISIDEAFLDVRGLERLKGAGARDRRATPARRARARRPADHRRRGAHEVPRQGGERRREAGRPSRRAGGRRARLPPPASRRAALGRRAGHLGEAARPRASGPSATSRSSAGARSSPCSAAGRGATCTRSRTTTTPGRCGRAAAAARSAPSARSAAARHGRRRRSTRSCSRSSTASRGGCDGRDGSGARWCCVSASTTSHVRRARTPWHAPRRTRRPSSPRRGACSRPPGR